MNAMADHIAHLLDDEGVTEVPFRRTGRTTYTNEEEIVLRPGATLELGGGLSISYPAEPLEIVIPWEGRLDL